MIHLSQVRIATPMPLFSAAMEHKNVYSCKNLFQDGTVLVDFRLIT